MKKPYRINKTFDFNIICHLLLWEQCLSVTIVILHVFSAPSSGFIVIFIPKIGFELLEIIVEYLN